MVLKVQMMSQTGPRNSCENAPGFTILEVILAIAIIILATSVVLINFASFTDFKGSQPPEEILYGAIRAARFQAASTRQTTELRFDKESGSLSLGGDTNFPLGEDFGASEPGEIRFFLVPPSTGLASFSDPADSRLETQVLRFAPDRSSSPFVAEVDSGRGTPQRLVFDPFSSLVRSPK